MASFEISEAFQLQDPETEISTLLSSLQTRLTKYYEAGDLIIEGNTLKIDGNLKGFFEQAVTKASIDLMNKDGKLRLSAKGKVSAGWLIYIWLIAGLLTGIFIVFFFFQMIEFLISRDRPKKYIEEALKGLKFEFEK